MEQFTAYQLRVAIIQSDGPDYYNPYMQILDLILRFSTNPSSVLTRTQLSLSIHSYGYVDAILTDRSKNADQNSLGCSMTNNQINFGVRCYENILLQDVNTSIHGHKHDHLMFELLHDSAQLLIAISLSQSQPFLRLPHLHIRLHSRRWKCFESRQQVHARWFRP